MRSGQRLRRWLAALAVPALALGWSITESTPAEASPQGVAACAVEDATITWGFKESFRSYISGSIANGEWAVSDGAEYQTPEFRFPDGAGTFDRGDRTGTIEFPGAITFTGHDGILNTTLENPVIEFDGDRASLFFDIHGTTQDGAEVDEQSVEFVTLALDEGDLAEGTDSALAFSSIPATLTDAGAEAFGTYQAGEPFDPVAIAIDFAGECEAPADSGWWLVGGLAAVTAAALTAALLWSRRRNHSRT